MKLKPTGYIFAVISACFLLPIAIDFIQWVFVGNTDLLLDNPERTVAALLAGCAVVAFIPAFVE